MGTLKMGLPSGTSSVGAKLVDIPRVHGATARTSPAVEAWVYRRENLDHFFKWNKRTTSRVLIWAVAVPFAMYAVISNQQVKQDQCFRMNRSGTNYCASADLSKQKYL